MPMARSFLSLRALLFLDAASCAAMGGLLALAPATLGRLTGIPEPLLLYAGLALLPVAAFMAAVALRPRPQPLAVRAIILGNVLWVAGSLALLVGLISPNTFGFAAIAFQAAVVAALAGLEQAALRTNLRPAPQAR